MKKKFLSFLLAFAMVATSVAPTTAVSAAESQAVGEGGSSAEYEAEDVLFAPKLEDDSEFDWFVGGNGSQSIADGKITIDDARDGGNKAVSKRKDFTNFVFETNIKITSGEQGCVVFRGTNPMVGADGINGYYACLDATKDLLELGCMHSDGNTNGWDGVMARASVAIDTNVEYRMVVTADGSTITVDLYNDKAEFMAEAKTEDARRTEGGIGVRSRFGAAEYTDIIVKELPKAAAEKEYQGNEVTLPDSLDGYTVNSANLEDNKMTFADGTFSFDLPYATKAITKEVYTDFVFEADIEMTGWLNRGAPDVAQGCLVFRGNNPSNGTDNLDGYCMVLWPEHNRFGISRVSNNRPVWTDMVYSQAVIDYNKTYHMKVVAKDNLATAVLYDADGNELGSVRMPVDITSGSVGVRAWDTVTTIKNLKLLDLDVTAAFDTDGGSTVESQDVDYNTTVVKPEDPTKAGFKFAGWYADEACEQEFDFDAPITKDVTIYAKWENQSKITVTFNTNGGTDIEAQTIAYGSAAVKPEDPTKADTAFKGWYKDESCTEKFDFSTLLTEDITLYALWAAPVTITFNTNGGTKVDSQTFASGLTAEKPADPTYGENFFKGWYADEGLETPYEFGAVEADTTVYAKWEAPYTPELTTDNFTAYKGNEGRDTESTVIGDGKIVITDANGAKAVANRQDFTDAVYEATINVASEVDGAVQGGILFRATNPRDGGDNVDGFYFGFNPHGTAQKGVMAQRWVADKSVDIPADGVGFNKEYRVAAMAVGKTITLFVIDEETGKIITERTIEDDTYTTGGIGVRGWQSSAVYTNIKVASTVRNITFNMNDGTDTVVDSQTLTYGKTPAAVKEPVREGYRFKGWYTDKDCTEGNEYELRTLTDDTQVYAKWAELVTITYDLDGGTWDGETSQEVEKGTVPGTPENSPVKDGAAFLGWYEVDGENVSEDTFDFTAALNKNVALKAKWNTLTDVTVNFDTDGGTKIDPVTVKYNEKVAKPETDPTKEGHTFEGWYADKACETEFDFDASVTKETYTVYAKWTPIKYKLTYNDGDDTTEDTVVEVAYGTKPEKPEKPVKEGYRFMGYYEDAGFATEYTFGPMGAKDIVVYEKWYKIPESEIFAPTFNDTDDFEFFPNGNGKFTAASGVASITGNGAGHKAISKKQDMTNFILETTIELGKANNDDNNQVGVLFRAKDGTNNMDGCNGYYFGLNGKSKSAQLGAISRNAPVWTEIADKQNVSVEYNKPYKIVVVAVDSTIRCYAYDEETGKEIVAIEAENDTYTVGGVGLRTFNTDGTYQNMTVSSDYNKNVIFLNDNTEVKALSVLYHDTVDADAVDTPEAPNDKVEFAGWYTDKDCTQKYDFASPVTKDIQLYAGWADKITVTFDTNGGSAVESQTIASGTAPEKVKDPTKEDAVFGGWYTDKDCTKAYEWGTAIKESTTLYARWIAKITVTFDTVGGNTVEPQSIAAGTAIKRVGNPTKEGYEFAGWYMDAEYKTAYEWGTAIEASTTLYAKWEAEIVTVTFVTGEGVSTINDAEVSVGTKVDAPADPTKEGYTFAGWYADEAYTTAFDFTAVITADTTIYAKWDKVITPPAGGETNPPAGGTTTPPTGGTTNPPADGTTTPPAAAEVTEVKVETAKVTLGIKETYAIKAAALPEDAKTTFTYESSDKKVASVDANGKVKALKKGKAKITVTSANGKTATVEVTVKQAPKKVTVAKKKVTIKKNKTFTIKYKLPKNTASNQITFKSSNKKVASVDENGKVKGLKKGKAKITVQTFNKKKVVITVTVK